MSYNDGCESRSLANMDDLVSMVINKHSREHMQEALISFNVGAYRGCIVLCYSVMFYQMTEVLMCYGLLHLIDQRDVEL